MKTNNVYVKYETVNSREELISFVNEGAPIFSNHKNYKQEIELLIAYKDQHLKNYKSRGDKESYRNVYGHYLKFLIPYEINKENWNDFVKAYIEAVDQRFKQLLWICKYLTVNDANYAEVICFTRTVYKKPRKVNDTYKQDYWFDKTTGQRCKEGHKNAVLKAKNGTVKTREDGSPITKTITVKETEERIFKYRSFANFTLKLKGKYLRIVKEMTNKFIYTVISRFTLKSGDSKSVINRKRKMNQSINEINSILKGYQDGINNGGFYNSVDDIYKQFHSLLDEVDEMIHEKNIEFEKIKEFIRSWWRRNVAEDFM